VIALRFQRSVPRYVASRALGRRAPGLVASHLAPLRAGHYDDPELPGAGWVSLAPRLAGICGSDLAMLSGEASFYFSPIVSMPFVPGHEVVATVESDGGGLNAGTRVVVEPVLACAARGIDPPCGPCASGDVGLCLRTANGHLAPGLQTGYCQDTGGGWGTRMVAHASQLHAVPEDVSDENAVLVEPLACAIHAALRAGPADGATVFVSGAGTMGLLTIAALRAYTPAGRIIAAAKHPHQRDAALRLGADEAIAPRSALRAIRLATKAWMHTPERGDAWLAGGVDASFECSGHAGGLETCFRATRGRGRVVLVGLPGASRIDLAPVWHRELEVIGAYTYGTEHLDGRTARTFELAIDLVQRQDLSWLVSARYPLARYAEAVDHAMDAGALGATKVVFDLG